MRRPVAVDDVIVTPVDTPQTLTPPPIPANTIVEYVPLVVPPVVGIAPPVVHIAPVVDVPRDALTDLSVRWCFCRTREQDYTEEDDNMVECTAVDCEFKWYHHSCMYEEEEWKPPAR